MSDAITVPRTQRIRDALTTDENRVLSSGNVLEYAVEQVCYRPPREVVEADRIIARHLEQSPEPSWDQVNVRGSLTLGLEDDKYYALVDINQVRQCGGAETSNLRPPRLTGLLMEVMDAITQSTDKETVTFYANMKGELGEDGTTQYLIHCRRPGKIVG